MSRPLFGRLGGKSRIANKIVPYFPPHKVYVEPMVGGGSVFFAKPPAEREILGDKDPDVITLFRAAKNGIKCNRNVRNQDHQRSLIKRHSGHACDIYSRIKCSFGSMGDSPSRPEDYPCPINWPNPDYTKRLRKVSLVKGDFEKTMRRYDSTKTLHYLDPPYYGTHGYGDGLAVDPERVKKAALAMRGNVVVSYNDHPVVRKTFCKTRQFKCRSIRQPVAACSKGYCGTRKDLVILKK